MTTIIYLAGAIKESEDHGVRWRNTVKEKVQDYDDIECVNPLDKINVPVEDIEVVDTYNETPEGVISVREIVTTDKKMIDKSDVLFVGYSKDRMIGTPMEVMYAYERDIPVVFWMRGSESNSVSGHEKDDMSPWFQYHGDWFIHNLDNLLAICSDYV